MKLKTSILLCAMACITSCTSEKAIPFDEAMGVLQDAGYSLSPMNVPDMRCMEGTSRDGTRVVFMHAYCAIEDEVDWITLAFNTAYPQRGKGNMLEVLNLIGWKLSASIHKNEADVIVLMGLYSKRFLEEVREP